MAQTQPSRSAIKARRSNFRAILTRRGYLPAGLLDVYRSDHGFIEIYNAAIQGLDPSGGPYAVVCESHGTCVNVDTLGDAREVAKHPEMFCESED